MTISLMLLHSLLLVLVLLIHVAVLMAVDRKFLTQRQTQRLRARGGVTPSQPAVRHFVFQSLANGLKMLARKEVVPSGVDRPIFFAAPFFALLCAISCWAVLPVAQGWVLSDLATGLLVFMLMGVLAGFARLLGHLSQQERIGDQGWKAREGEQLGTLAQMLGVWLAVGVSLLGVVIVSGSLNLSQIVAAQGHRFWDMHIFSQGLGFVIVFLAMLGCPDSRRNYPGYGGLYHAFFLVSDYVGMLALALVACLCYLGGWQGPWTLPYCPPLWLLLKLYLLLLGWMIVRARWSTGPHPRLVQVLGWQWLLPVALLNTLVTVTLAL